MYMEWDESFSVGVSRFDEQHKILFSLINSLLDGIKEQRRTEVMGSVLEELINYTVNHFGQEETEMQTYSYPEYERHKKEHDELSAKVTDFHVRFKAGTAVMTVELMGFLVNWLKTHIAHTDKKYRPFMAENGVK